jgi:radical SAM protein (TIGR01212 family)
MPELYKSYKEYLQERYPEWKQVRKVTLDGGFTCPNLDGSRARGGCTYCNNKSFSPALQQRNLSISEQLQRSAERLPARFQNAGWLAYFQPYTNTYAEVSRLESLYREAMEFDKVIGLSIGTRPDCIDENVRDLLRDLAQEMPITLEIGIQTAHQHTLDYLNRAHTMAEFEQAMDMCSGIAGLDLGTHVILGLPGESHADFRFTAEYLQGWEFAAIKIHPLHIVKGTKMATQYADSEFSLLSLDEYIEAVVDFVERTPAHTAIERFTGDSPSELHVAPDWSGNRQAIVSGVESLLQERGSRQGSLVRAC